MIISQTSNGNKYFEAQLTKVSRVRELSCIGSTNLLGFVVGGGAMAALDESMSLCNLSVCILAQDVGVAGP